MPDPTSDLDGLSCIPMPTRFTGRLLAHLAHQGYRPSTLEDIARQMQVPVDEREVFALAVERL